MLYKALYIHWVDYWGQGDLTYNRYLILSSQHDRSQFNLLNIPNLIDIWIVWKYIT